MEFVLQWDDFEVLFYQEDKTNQFSTSYLFESKFTTSLLISREIMTHEVKIYRVSEVLISHYTGMPDFLFCTLHLFKIKIK